MERITYGRTDGSAYISAGRALLLSGALGVVAGLQGRRSNSAHKAPRCRSVAFVAFLVGVGSVVQYRRSLVSRYGRREGGKDYRPRLRRYG